MIIRITTLTNQELEELYSTLSLSARVLRQLGKHQAAATCKAVASEASQQLLRRTNDHRSNVTRQLTLSVPGAYGESSDHLSADAESSLAP